MSARLHDRRADGGRRSRARSRTRRGPSTARSRSSPSAPTCSPGGRTRPTSSGRRARSRSTPTRRRSRSRRSRTGSGTAPRCSSNSPYDFWSYAQGRPLQHVRVPRRPDGRLRERQQHDDRPVRLAQGAPAGRRRDGGPRLHDPADLPLVDDARRRARSSSGSTSARGSAGATAATTASASGCPAGRSSASRTCASSTSSPSRSGCASAASTRASPPSRCRGDGLRDRAARRRRARDRAPTDEELRILREEVDPTGAGCGSSDDRDHELPRPRGRARRDRRDRRRRAVDPETAERARAATRGQRGRAAAVRLRARRDRLQDGARFVEGRDEWTASARSSAATASASRRPSSLAALLRARGIPAGLVVQDLLDHKIPAKYAEFIGSQMLETHGLTCAFVDGRWVLLDATLDRGLVERKGYRLVEFDGTGDAVLADTDAAGQPHFDVVEELGAWPDMPDEIVDRVMSFEWLHSDEYKAMARRHGRGCDDAELARAALEGTRGARDDVLPACRTRSPAPGPRRRRAAREPRGPGRVALRPGCARRSRASGRAGRGATPPAVLSEPVPDGNAELLAARERHLAGAHRPAGAEPDAIRRSSASSSPARSSGSWSRLRTGILRMSTSPRR